jgi:carbonic anhydrase/acetyltransferase-like protein (isoleucine patch superfamily)
MQDRTILNISRCANGDTANIASEDYVMLGAGALVPPGKVLQSGYLYIGSPAKKTRILSGSEKEFLEYSSAHYVLLKNEYLEP